jgi:hypothetical protein
LLSDRFALLPADRDAVEIEQLLAAFHRYPRLPKLASQDVLRTCLLNGVQQKVFALASGSAWSADDAVIRFGTLVDPTEVQFQPGIWLVRATAAKNLLDQRAPEPKSETTAPSTLPQGAPEQPTTSPGQLPEHPGIDQQPGTTHPRAGGPTRLAITIKGVPADKARDVVKVAILPLASQSAEVAVDFTITAKARDGIPSHTLDLVVKEGLRQLGVEHEMTTE